jgi:uncharacterized protein YqjF (DUF2071 family)
MRWHDLLFMHWPVDAAIIRPLIPAALRIDTFDGQAWIGVVPFRMTGVRPRCVPSIAGLSAFPELNVRSYVMAHDKPGVWFFSLDAASRPAVWAARRTFYLPYYFACMRMTHDGKTFEYSSRRVHRGAAAAEFRARYIPAGPSFHAMPETLDHWLVSRYCLYSADKQGRVWRGEIDHALWDLQPARAEIETNTMAEAIGIRLPPTEPLLHFSRRLDVVAWRVRPLS